MALNRHCEPRSGEAIFIHPQYSLINAEIASSAYGLTCPVPLAGSQ
jgi:hypothetical protein